MKFVGLWKSILKVMGLAPMEDFRFDELKIYAADAKGSFMCAPLLCTVIYSRSGKNSLCIRSMRILSHWQVGFANILIAKFSTKPGINEKKKFLNLPNYLQFPFYLVLLD